MLEGLSLSGISGKYWNVLLMIRWALVSVILVVARDYPALQIITNLFLSHLYQFMIIRGKPMEDSFENKMAFFNELMVSLYLYLLISLTDYNLSDDLYDPCGIALLSVVILCFVVNFLKFIIFFLRTIYFLIKRKYV
jgi:hypothetical protein